MAMAEALASREVQIMKQERMWLSCLLICGGLATAVPRSYAQDAGDQGGAVFLHTDAAQIFGYRTVPARRTTNRLAGQTFGRARAALPFGAHPLLWGAVGGRGGTARGGRQPVEAGGGAEGAQDGGGRSGQ